MAYKAFGSKGFNAKLAKMDTEFQRWVGKVENQLAENPYAGDPLGMKWFREKKHGKFRLYFLVYEDKKTVYIVAMGDKKSQQKTINTIKLLVDVYREEIGSLDFT